jgi:hypothetical protein
LSVAQGGNLQAANPEAAALANARAMQDLQLAAQAQQAGQQNVAFGAGLFGTGSSLLGQYQQGQVGALSPFQSYLQSTQGIEQMGQQPLDIGINIGAKGQSPASAQAMLTGGTNAANSMAAANAYNPFATALISGAQNPQLQNAFANWTGGFGGAKSGAAGYNISPNAYADYYKRPTAFE